MEFKMTGIEEQKMKTSELLAPLTKEERNTFGKLLYKLRESDTDITTLSVFIVDKLHGCHTKELGTSLTILINKLVHEPFIGDRDLLRTTLETIMKAVAHVENEQADN